VYINGAYAGKASELKSIWLQPDAYDLEIRAQGYSSYTERFYLLPGKTRQVKVDLVPATPQ
jgi:PEGA domain